MTNTELARLILDMGSISGLIALVYTVTQNLRRRPRFKFDFRGSNRQLFNKANLEYCRFIFDGYVKNQSLDPNSLTAIHLVLWENKKRNRHLSFGHTPIAIVNKGSDAKLRLPISFQPREGKHLTLTYEIPLTGTHDRSLVHASRRLDLEEGMAWIPKHNYTLVFIDVNENLFDERGVLRNLKELDLQWTLVNTFESLKRGNPIPYLRHLFFIWGSKVAFKARMLLFAVGIWK